MKVTRSPHAAVAACAAGAVAVMLALTGCASSGSAASSSAASSADAFSALRSKSQVNLGVASVAPSSYITPAGKLAGAEVETTLQVLSDLGIKQSKVKGTALDFNAMIPALQAKQQDLLSSSLFINSTRCGQVAFSEPIFVGTYSIITMKSKFDGSARPKTLADVKAKGLKLGLQAGGVQTTMATKAGIDESNRAILPNIRGVIDALKAGQVDAVLAVGVQIKAALTGDEKDNVVVGPVLKDAPLMGSGVAFRKDDTALRDEFNKKLAVVKKNGTFDKIMKKYSIDPAPAKTATTAELCKNPS
jgi:polar amino acid transport system substrate-binding protein